MAETIPPVGPVAVTPSNEGAVSPPETPVALEADAPPAASGSSTGMGDITDYKGATASDGSQPPTDTGMGDIRDFKGATPSGEGGTDAVVGGAVKGAIEGTGMIAGAASGFRAGLALPIPHPLGKAAAAIIGGVGGGIYGVFAGHYAVDSASKVKLPSGAPLTYKTLDDVPPHLRTSFIFGENMGAGVAFMGPQVTAAKLGVKTVSNSFVGSVFNDIMSSAKNKTARFVAGELITTTGSAAGGSMAQETFPDELGPRIFGEVAGGILSPAKGVMSAASFVFNRASGILKVFSPAARETAAAKIIQSVYATADGDIELAAKLLRQHAAELPESTATAAQRVGDEALISLESALVADNARFSSEAARRAEATLNAYKDTIAILRGSGDADALKEAATIEARYFTMLLSERAMEAKRVASDAAAELLSKATKIDRTSISLRAYEAADAALSQSRAVEKSYWARVPTDLPATSKSIEVAFKALMGRKLPDYEAPVILVKTLKRLEEQGGVTDVGFLKLFRTEMLSMARQASSNPERAAEASIYGHLAEAALDDMDMVFKNPNTAGLLRTMGADPDAYDAARAFSRSLHDSFTNTFTGQNLAEGSRGLRLAPEALLGRATAGGAVATEFRLKELEESTRFLVDRGLGGVDAQTNLQKMLDAQESFVSIIAADVAGIETGPARVTAIKKYMANNPELMARFGDVKKLLTEVATSQEALESVGALNKSATSTMRKRAAWATLANSGSDPFDSPVDAVTHALSSRSPIKSFTHLAKLAMRGTKPRGAGKAVDDALDGFSTTVYDHAFRASTSADGVLDFTKLRASFFDPIRPGKPSVADIMLENGSVTEKSLKDLSHILDLADKVVKAQTQTGVHVDVDGPTDFLMKAVSRIIGARTISGAAGVVGGGHGGSGLIVASAGANLGDRILNAIPVGKVKDLLIEATQNPELMVKLMEKPVGEAEVLRHGLSLHLLLIKLGVIPVTPMALGGETAVSNATE